MQKYILLLLLWGNMSLLYSQAPSWPVNPGDYQYTMTVIDRAANDCEETTNPSIVGVFDSEGNCRGKSTIELYPIGQRAFLNVYSNAPLETLFFRVYDSSLNEVFSIYSTQLDFQADGSAGDGNSPVQVIYDTNIMADAGEDQVITNSTETTLEATGTGFWTIFRGENGQLSDINDPNATFTGELEETYILTWTVNDNNCELEIDPVFIQFTSNSSVCPISHFISGDLNNDAFYQATNSITADNRITSNAKVTYRAAESIILNGGFEVVLGSEFLAEIGNCQVNPPSSLPALENDFSFSLQNSTTSQSATLFPNPATDIISIDLKNW
jgi:hypothetical protein